MFLPPELFGFGKLSQAPTLSILVSVSKYANSFLVGGGDDPIAIMIDGAHEGHFMKVHEGENFKGMTISGVKIEVDHESAYVVRGIQRPLMSVVRHRNGVGIIAQPEARTYGRHNPCIVWEGQPLDPAEDSVGFTRWNAFVMVGDTKHVLHAHRGDLVTSN